MDSQEIKGLTNEYILPTYGRFDLALTTGKGCEAQDAEGNSYLDFTSGIGVNCLGWCDEEWVAAVAAQAATLQHTSNLYYTSPAAELAETLCKRTGMAGVFFANGGGEANEGAIKIARKYSRDNYGVGHHTILTLENSFHGRTLATITATGQEQFHQHFNPFVPGFKYVPANDIDALLAEMDGTVCGIWLEPVQGEGGVLPLDKEYLAAVQKLCAEKDILLMADEVQTGVGRTGSFIACQQLGIQPDILTLAKGIGGGLPLAAVLAGEKCKNTLQPGDHATTYGGNPVCCAAANAVMKKLDDAMLAEVARKGALLKEKLMALPGVESVDGLGLMLGVTFTGGIAARDVLLNALDRGVLFLLAKHKLRLLPPLVITDGQIEQGVQTLKEILEDMA